jgi:hypothetical protein
MSFEKDEKPFYLMDRQVPFLWWLSLFQEKSGNEKSYHRFFQTTR